MDSANCDQLKALFDKYRSIVRPRGGGDVFVGAIGRDVDVDMWEEDSYLAGLVNSFLSGKRLTVDSISLDFSVDDGLADSLSKVENREKDAVRKYIEYRKSMRELARALSAASGLPMEGKSGSE